MTLREKAFLSFVMLSGQLTDECHGKAILDSGCSTTVTGKKWLTD